MKRITPAEAREILIGLIGRDAPHANHAQNVADAKFWRSIRDGKGQDDLLTSYKPRESEAQKKQRIAISHTPTPEAFYRVTRPLSRLDNPDGLVRNIQTEADAMSPLLERLAKFGGGKGLDQFVYDNFKEANTIDPNAYLVVTMTGQRGAAGEWLEKPYPMPETVPCEEVYDMGAYNGAPIWLARLQRSTARDGAGKEVERLLYTLYFDDHILQAVSVVDENAADVIEVEVGREKMQYALTLYYLGGGEVPFIEWGYLSAGLGRFMSILAPVETRFRQLINRSSELELSIALHAFLQKYQFTRPCRNTEPQKGMCQGGTMSVSREQCGKCGGTGKHIAATVQDVMLFDLPESRDEYFPLADMVHFPTMPFEIVKFLNAELPAILAEMERTLWGTNIAPAPGGDTVAVTATEVMGRYDTVYKALSDMGAHIERVWGKCLRLTAAYAELGAITYRYEYPATFQMETLPELLATLSAAKSAGAPIAVIEAIEVQILKKQGQVDPETIAWHRATQRHRPFRAKPADEVAAIISGMPEASRYRVLYTYFDEIFEAIRQRPEAFTLLPFTEQSRIVEEEVEKIAAVLRAEAPNPAPFRQRVAGE